MLWVLAPRESDTSHIMVTEPTGHGLGKADWVTVRIDEPAGPSLDVLLEWLDESYRAIAPTRLVAQLDEAGPG